MTTENIPKVFVSYSHDDKEHKDWILTLSSRLVANGVNVLLDQWDLNLGGDLPQFMESGLAEADRILVICTAPYVAKANAGKGGVGYEKMILTAQLMRDVTTEKIIPLIRRNNSLVILPTFLGARVYIDFRDPAYYEAKYAELLREIHGVKIKPRPPLGNNPFAERETFSTPLLDMRAERYVAPTSSGTATFDYSNNNGRFTIGAGDMTFETSWSRASNTAIHVYADTPSIQSIALAAGIKSIFEIDDASVFDTSSRTRTPHLGEIVIMRNTAGYYAAVKVEKLKSRSHGDCIDEITFTYAIQTDRSTSFKALVC